MSTNNCIHRGLIEEQEYVDMQLIIAPFFQAIITTLLKIIYIRNTILIEHWIMHYSSLEKDKQSSRKVYLIVFYIAATIMASITFYALAVSIAEYRNTGKIVIGEVLVTTEFPAKGLSKLVTYLMIVSVVAWYCVTKLGGEKVKNVNGTIRAILRAYSIDHNCCSTL